MARLVSIFEIMTNETEKRYRKALEEISYKFTQAHRDALERHKDSGTSAFEDCEWMEAVNIKPIHDIAVSALANAIGEATLPE